MNRCSNEAHIILAIQAIKNDPRLSIRRAAATYNVNRATLQGRMRGRCARADCRPSSKKLKSIEEQTLLEYILDLDSRGFPPTLQDVGEFANLLLAERDGGRVASRWPGNFVKRHQELKTRFSRKYDYQRALCEDPELVRGWFELVRNMRAKYGVQDADFYNFDETGFAMGQITPTMVVTRSETRGKPKKAQPGNREWVTLIQGINAEGWCIPPFFAVKGSYHLANWYTETGIPSDWVLKPTINGWTDNETGMDWIRHFDRHTASRTRAAYRMLVIDSHGSYTSVDFQQFCKEKKIILISMPSHLSHLLQPLDVGCFSPLKRAYGDQISELMKLHITNISKVEFLVAIKAIFSTVFREENIKAGFRGAGLVPYNPEAVLSKLNIKIRTPSPQLPLQPGSSHWTSQTPQTTEEIKSQFEYIKDRISRHQGSSPTSIYEDIHKLAKRAQRLTYDAVLLEDRMQKLEGGMKLLSKRRRAKRTRLRLGGPLSGRDATDLLDQNDIKEQLDRETRENGGQRARVGTRTRRCGNCGKEGHNSRTCDQAIDTSEESCIEVI